MGEHVHVRFSEFLGVSESGELVERSRCHCGFAWTRTYRVEDGEPDSPPAS
ncbi:hypothetical protein [Streptomyces griseus]|uniref:hypothetical protein n=1 Tax=Streptomyces griseus TaxID=1911 RepID=UPI000A49FA26|nr:hypothetical protein [Streptomyces griseus]